MNFWYLVNPRRYKVGKLINVYANYVELQDIESGEYIIVHESKIENMRPRIICLCGSTKFGKEFEYYNLKFTLDGFIVLSIGCNTKSDSELFATLSEDEKIQIKKNLDELHLRKIDLADEIFIINVNKYIGESTRKEIEYAKLLNKPIKYLHE
jgi:hypothetical protein